MALGIIFLIASLLVFLILTETLTVRFVYSDVKRIDVDLNVIGVSLFPTRSRKRKKEKESMHSPRRSLERILSIGAWLSVATLKVNSLTVSIAASEPMELALKRAAAYSFISALFAYASERSAFFCADNIIINASGNNKSELSFDIELEAALLRFIAAAIALFLRRAGKRLRERGCFKKWRTEK